MAGTPESTPTDNDQDRLWIDKAPWSSDPGIDLACCNYFKEHNECPQEDEYAYLSLELESFMIHDVKIINVDGERIASLCSRMQVKVTLVYQWIVIGYPDFSEWNIFAVSTEQLLDRDDPSLIQPGEYLLSGEKFISNMMQSHNLWNVQTDI